MFALPAAIRLLLVRFGYGRLLSWLLWLITLGPLWTFAAWVVGSGAGVIYGVAFWVAPALWSIVYSQFLKLYPRAVSQVGEPLNYVITQATGLNLGIANVQNVLDGKAGDPDLLAIGREFARIFDDIFGVEAVAAAYEARNPGGPERDNFERFLGRSFKLQASSAAQALFGDQIPFGLADKFESIGEMLSKTLGLEDAFEETLEPLMEMLIVEGMKKGLNRRIRPVDLAPSDAFAAYIAGYLGEQPFNQIMANEGIRADIIPILLNLRGKNLSESDLADQYYRGIITRDELKVAFRQNGYLPDDAEDKTVLVTGDRFWKLKTELLNCKEQQYAHGIITENDLRNYLTSINFDQQEEDIEVEIAKCKASLRRTAQPKQITGTFNAAPLRVKPGGFTVLVWNIKNAENVTISDLGAVGPRGERVIYPTVSKTYYLDATSDTDSERFEAVVVVGDTKEIRRPTVSFTAAPGTVTIGTPVELKWTTSNADSVDIDQIGPVQESGATFVYPVLTTIYTIRATNVAGTTVRQDVVFVKLPDFPGAQDLRPRISFSITPGVVKASQPSAEMKWSLSGADEGEITFPDGSVAKVGRNGAAIITASDSGIYTLKARNSYGETQNQEALIFTQPAESEPPIDPTTLAPQLSFSVSPLTTQPGEDLFLFWQIALSTTGQLVLPDGTVRVVGVSGSQTYKAPAVEGNYEFRLQAENANGPAALSVNVMVSTAR